MKKLLYSIITTCSISATIGQQKISTLPNANIQSLSKTTNLPLHVTFNETSKIATSNFFEWMNESLVHNTDVSFKLIKETKDQLGFTHNRLQQYYKNYKIEDAIILTHSKNNLVTSFNGDWFNSISVSNTITLTENQALQFALTKVGAKKYKWENKAEEVHMSKTFNNPTFSYYPVGELCIVTTSDSETKITTFQYVYKFNIYAEKPLYRANIYVNAATGKIIKEQNLICTIDAVGSANTKYSGVKPITTDSYTGEYRLRETGRGLGIETYNLNNTTTYTNTDFTNTTNNWTSTGNNQAATDAHFGAEATYDFYLQTFNRNSIDDNGYKLVSYLHYDVGLDNAFWNGQVMTYGDGNVSQGTNIMTALDVCGHEITHGLVQNTAGLNGGEADALNESFADIFGTSVEWFARPTQRDWLMGKDISTTNTPIRNMSNPNSLQEPDTYEGNYWDAQDEPHTNAGPCNYWFYLLSVGGNGTNDKGQTYTVSSITMAKAQAIAYRALTTYMTPSTNYASVRVYCIQAAKDLYGNCSNEVIQTTNAWFAVGVGTQYNASNIATNFSASQSISCSLPAFVLFSNTTAAGQAYTWHFGDGTTSNAINTSHTYTANGKYSVKLVSTGCTPNAKDSLLKTNFININAASLPVASNISICFNSSGIFSATSNGVVNWYDNASGGILLGTGSNYSTPTLTSNTTYYAISSLSNTPIYGGPTTNTVFGGGSAFSGSDRYLIFNVSQPSVLKTVKVYATTAGNRIIELRNSAGTVLQTATVNIAAGLQTVTLNFSLTIGNGYQLGNKAGTLTDMYRNNTGSGYPYNIGGITTITGTDAGNSFYYFYYNWEIQRVDCKSAAKAVTAAVNVCTGLNSLIAENSIQLFPNPTNDKLIIQLPSEIITTIKHIEIYDGLGKIVKTINTPSLENSFSVAELSAGVYTCKFIDGSKQALTKRFIKQ